MITINSDAPIGAKRILAHACAGDVVTVASGRPITGNSRIFDSKKPRAARQRAYSLKIGGMSSEDS